MNFVFIWRKIEFKNKFKKEYKNDLLSLSKEDHLKPHKSVCQILQFPESVEFLCHA